MPLRIIQVLVTHADAPRDGERTSDVGHLFPSVTVGAEGESDTRGVGTTHESLVNRERDAQATSAAIRQVVEAVRTGRPLAH